MSSSQGRRATPCRSAPAPRFQGHGRSLDGLSLFLSVFPADSHPAAMFFKAPRITRRGSCLKAARADLGHKDAPLTRPRISLRIRSHLSTPLKRHRRSALQPVLPASYLHRGHTPRLRRCAEVKAAPYRRGHAFCCPRLDSNQVPPSYLDGALAMSYAELL